MRQSKKSRQAYSSIQQTALIFAVCLLAGCASVDNALRMNPTTAINATSISTQLKASPLTYGLVLYNVEPDGTLQQIPDISGLSPELYVTVDVSGVVNAALKGTLTKEDRNTIVSFLIYLSDRNSDVWMNRVYAQNKLRKTVLGTTRDLATTGAGVSALIIPPVAAGLSAFNLLAGTSSDQIDATIYSNETIETLFKGITAARKDERNQIKGHFGDLYTSYDMFYALDQLRYYDSLVSFRKGLAYLGNLADQKNQQAQTAENTNNPVPAAKAAAAIPTATP